MANRRLGDSLSPVRDIVTNDVRDVQSTQSLSWISRDGHQVFLTNTLFFVLAMRYPVAAEATVPPRRPCAELRHAR